MFYHLNPWSKKWGPLQTPHFGLPLIFMVDHIVFVLAVNRTELAHSIRALYGSGFDAQGYLRRFFDVDFQLPDVGRKRFIEATLDTIQLNEYVRRTRDSMAQQWHDTVKTLLLAFFDVPDLSLWRISQAIFPTWGDQRYRRQPFPVSSLALYACFRSQPEHFSMLEGPAPKQLPVQRSSSCCLNRPGFSGDCFS